MFKGAWCVRVLVGMVACLVMSMAAVSAKADPTTYTYAGQPLTNFNLFAPCPGGPICQVTGSFTVDDLLPANGFFEAQGILPLDPGAQLINPSYSFTDGVTVLDPTDSQIVEFFIRTDANGHIDDWGIFLSQGDPENQTFVICITSVLSACNSSPGPIFDYVALNINEPNATPPRLIVLNAFNTSGPGTWMGGGLPENGNGNGNNNGPTPTPEPSAFSLLLTGAMLLLGTFGFRKMQFLEAAR